MTSWDLIDGYPNILDDVLTLQW